MRCSTIQTAIQKLHEQAHFFPPVAVNTAVVAAGLSHSPRWAAEREGGCRREQGVMCVTVEGGWSWRSRDFCIKRGDKPPGSSPPGLPTAAGGPLVCPWAPRNLRVLSPPCLPSCEQPFPAAGRGAEHPQGHPACPSLAPQRLQAGTCVSPRYRHCSNTSSGCREGGCCQRRGAA